MIRARHPERGSVTVEFAFVLPFLAVMAFGIMELGLALQSRMTVQAAVRAGARVGSAAGAGAGADQTVLLGVGAALTSARVTDVSYVVVYKASAAGGAIPAACTGPPRAVSGQCNAYTGDQMAQVVAGTAPASWFGCGAGALDSPWCPTGRQTIQALGTDYLGVWVQARHQLRTGFFGTSLSMSSQAVMRLEPKSA